MDIKKDLHRLGSPTERLQSLTDFFLSELSMGFFNTTIEKTAFYFSDSTCVFKVFTKHYTFKMFPIIIIIEGSIQILSIYPYIHIHIIIIEGSIQKLDKHIATSL